MCCCSLRAQVSTCPTKLISPQSECNEAPLDRPRQPARRSSGTLRRAFGGRRRWSSRRPVGTVDPLVCWHTAILYACAASASCRRSLSAACHSSVACASPNVPTTRRLRHGVFARKAGKVSYLCSLLLGDALRGLEQPISRAWRWAEPKGFLRRAKLAAVACEASQLAKSLPASISRIFGSGRCQTSLNRNWSFICSRSQSSSSGLRRPTLPPVAGSILTAVYWPAAPALTSSLLWLRSDQNSRGVNKTVPARANSAPSGKLPAHRRR